MADLFIDGDKTMQWVIKALAYAAFAVLLSACATNKGNQLPGVAFAADDAKRPDYLIGPGDEIQIFVWRNPEVSQTIKVRPDGRISTPLVEDLIAGGKTPTQLARDIEKALATYIREPIVTVIVNQFIGPYSQQVRVIGEATTPKAIPYSKGMTLLDVIIAVGGLTEFAAGNRASIVRLEEGNQKEYRVRIDDLIKGGEISANVEMQPGDILIIPESWL